MVSLIWLTLFSSVVIQQVLYIKRAILRAADWYSRGLLYRFVPREQRVGRILHYLRNAAQQVRVIFMIVVGELTSVKQNFLDLCESTVDGRSSLKFGQMNAAK